MRQWWGPKEGKTELQLADEQIGNLLLHPASELYVLRKCPLFSDIKGKEDRNTHAYRLINSVLCIFKGEAGGARWYQPPRWL